MKMLSVFVFIAISASAFAANEAHPSLVSGQGILSQQSDLHWQVHLPEGRGTQMKGQQIARIAFGVDALIQETWCKKYEGRNVEVSGEVSSVAHRLVTIKLHSITLGEPTAMSPADSLRRYLTKEIDPNEHAPGQPLYRFAYFLVLLDPPSGCERCYVPLLIMTEPLDVMVSRKQAVNGVWLITYERDSIWQANGPVLLTVDAVDLSLQTLHFRGKNYRYEGVPSAAVSHLLEHPMGTIPISRPLLPNLEMAGSSTKDLIAGFHTILRVRERQGAGLIHLRDSNSNLGVPTQPPATSPFTSELTVFDDGKVQFRLAPECTNRFIRSENSQVVAESWNWRETCPGSQRIEENVSYTLTPVQLLDLKNLLNQEAVERVRECFCNAAPILDDYEIEIPRQDSIQDILVFAFLNTSRYANPPR